jgi:hypothetical protein
VPPRPRRLFFFVALAARRSSPRFVIERVRFDSGRGLRAFAGMSSSSRGQDPRLSSGQDGFESRRGHCWFHMYVAWAVSWSSDSVRLKSGRTWCDSTTAHWCDPPQEATHANLRCWFESSRADLTARGVMANALDLRSRSERTRLPHSDRTTFVHDMR